jgi:hypothetical protein
VTETRLLVALERLLKQLLPELPFLRPYRYRVVQMTSSGDGRVELQAVRKAAGLPDVLPASILPGIPGASSRLKPGAVVVVEFIEGDPQLPIVTHFEAEGGQGFLPVALALDASSSVRVGEHASSVRVGPGDGQPVARKTDPVAVGQLSVIGGSGALLQFTPAGGLPGVAASAVTLSGVVQDGSTLLSSA